MKWPFVFHSVYEAVCADRERIRGERNQFAEDCDAHQAAAKTAARQLAEADATNRRLQGRITELTRRLAEAPPATASREEIDAWEARVKAHDAWTRPADPEARPVDGASGRPTHPATELRRALDRCLALEARLAVAEGRNRKAVAS